MTKRLIAGVATLLAAITFGARAQTRPAGEVVLRAAAAPVIAGAWAASSDAGASNGTALWTPDAGVPKLAAASAAPRDYFELTFQARAGVPYRLWFRGKAAADSWTNDSAFVQFSGSTDASGVPAFRIGTTSATVVSLEACSGCGVLGWGWSDNGYGGDGAPIYFASDGPQTIRVQGREDGFIVDEIVLSPQKYLSAAPGAAKQDTTILPPSDGSAGAGVTLVRGPYLQQPSDRSMTIVWATRESGTAEVRHQAGTSTVAVTATSRLVTNTTTLLGYDYYHHEATLTGLAPSTTYTYRPYVNGVAAAAQSSFRTAPSVGTGGVSFLAFGDSGTGSIEQRQLGAAMANENVDLVLHVGDIVYGTSATTGDATYVTYQKWFFDIYSWLPRVPFVPTEGNHDSRPTNQDGRAYLDLFSLPENGAIRERYYSFDHGPVHFIVLDTEYAFQDAGRRAEQLAWVESDLAATRQPWKVALYHRSAYSSGAEHGSDLVVRAAFGPLFERYGVDLSLSGHDHDYERTKPMRESTDPSSRPVTYVVTGGGGAELYPVGTSTFTAFSASRYEYTRVRVEGCTMVIEGIGLDGAAFDRSTLSHCTTTQPSEVVLHTTAATRAGAWTFRADTTAAGGGYVIHPDAGAAKIGTASATPANFVELSFNATAGVPYRLWLRSRAQSDYYGNDSVFVQFSGSVDAGGTPMWRIGTADATTVVLEDCGGCGEQGWGWQDNGYGVLGPVVYFATSGPQRVRIQTREDGLGIDQVVLSPGRYLSTSPGALKNDTTILTPSGGQ
jgi:acid phosphatase type 7